MSTRQIYDFRENIDTNQYSCKLAAETFIIIINLKHCEKNGKSRNVAKDKFFAKFIKQTSFVFFKNLIVIISYAFKK